MAGINGLETAASGFGRLAAPLRSARPRYTSSASPSDGAGPDRPAGSSPAPDRSSSRRVRLPRLPATAFGRLALGRISAVASSAVSRSGSRNSIGNGRGGVGGDGQRDQPGDQDDPPRHRSEEAVPRPVGGVAPGYVSRESAPGQSPDQRHPSGHGEHERLAARRQRNPDPDRSPPGHTSEVPDSGNKTMRPTLTPDTPPGARRPGRCDGVGPVAVDVYDSPSRRSRILCRVNCGFALIPRFRRNDRYSAINGGIESTAATAAGRTLA